jgi:TetR/AcrR family transcriptional regulator
MPKVQAKPERKTRIQSQNEQIILDAALEVFSAYGYRGGTIDQIAARCGLSKPNLLYYFRRKDDIYKAVLGTHPQRLAGTAADTRSRC